MKCQDILSEKIFQSVISNVVEIWSGLKGKIAITKTSLFKYTENFTTKKMKMKIGNSNGYPQYMFQLYPLTPVLL